MRASCTAKHATHQKAEKFWDEVSIVSEELVVNMIQMNKSHPEFVAIKTGHGTESLHNCWPQ